MKAKDVRYPDAALARGVAARRERQERASESGPEAALREHERSCERCRPRPGGGRRSAGRCEDGKRLKRHVRDVRLGRTT